MTPEELPSSSSHYIEFAHVYKTFDKPVLVDASFYVDAGETLAIIGRSGVGKSVSLGHIMGFLKPDSGKVYVAYTNITDAGKRCFVRSASGSRWCSSPERCSTR